MMNKIDKVIILILILIGIYISYKYLQTNEGYINMDGENIIGATIPTPGNPFMNVLLDEIKDNPQRGSALSVQEPAVQIYLDDYFKTDFLNDPTDVFGKTQSQRQFITMPSTSIPNDQESYQNWLYKVPGKTCKEGGRISCMPGTDGSPLVSNNINP